MMNIEPLFCGTVEFELDTHFPTWSNLRFLEKMNLHHLRLVQIQRFCKLTSIGLAEDDFAISENSAELFEEDPYESVFHRGVMAFGPDDDTADEFWKNFRNYKRPVIFYREDYNWLPLYGCHPGEEFHVVSMHEDDNSVQISIQGALAALLELSVIDLEVDDTNSVSGVTELAETTGLSKRVLYDMTLVSEAVEQDGMPDRVQEPARKRLNAVLEEQEELNETVKFKLKELNKT